MKKDFWGVIVPFLLVLIFVKAPAIAFEGPLQTRNQFPLFGNLDTPCLESALTGNSFSAGLSHSSVFMLKNSTSWAVNMDFEVTELELRYRREIAGLFEIGIDLPVLSFNSGFMDIFFCPV